MKTQTWCLMDEKTCYTRMTTGSSFDDEEIGLDDYDNYFFISLMRGNGSATDTPTTKLPKDGKYTWIKGEVKGNYVYGVKNKAGKYEYEGRYDAGPGDLAWFKQNDCNYLARILKEGRLRECEPAVWYLRGEERAQGTDIGDWWSKKLKLSNLDAILKKAEEAELQLRKSGAEAPWEKTVREAQARAKREQVEQQRQLRETEEARQKAQKVVSKILQLRSERDRIDDIALLDQYTATKDQLGGGGEEQFIFYRERGDFYIYLAEKGKSYTQKVTFYQKALGDYKQSMVLRPLNSEIQTKIEVLEKQLKEYIQAEVARPSSASQHKKETPSSTAAASQVGLFAHHGETSELSKWLSSLKPEKREKVLKLSETQQIELMHKTKALQQKTEATPRVSIK